MRRARVLVGVVALAVVAGIAGAQESYPTRPITLVAPFPPGGVADLTARPVAAALEKVLKNPVGVVNKTGAAGAVGMQFVATSKPRSEEHTSELQSHSDLVCRLLLEKKKKNKSQYMINATQQVHK